MNRIPSLWLVRHAQPLIPSGVCYGQLDLPADHSLTLQAAMRFMARMPRGSLIRYSPLQRCEQLALVLHAPENNLLPDPRIQEMAFGQWEGRAWGDIGREEIDAWSQDLYDTAPGGGECLMSMLHRVKEALMESWHTDSEDGARDVVWITHAGVIRCVHWLLRFGEAKPTAQDWHLPAPSFGHFMSLPWQEYTAELQALG